MKVVVLAAVDTMVVAVLADIMEQVVVDPVISTQR
jgi:hypothetical protein